MLANINSNEDIVNHKMYPRDYEHHMPSLKDPSVIKNISQHFQKAQAYEEMFTDDEINWIYGYAFSRCQTVRHNDNGTIFISGNLNGVYEKFAKRINEIIPGAENSPLVGGNFFITPSQYGLHNDSTRESDWTKSLYNVLENDEKRKWVPWRNVIIPIFTAPPNVESHGVFFDQRHIDFAHVYNHGMKPGQETATTYPIISDHSQVDFYLLDGSVQDKEKNLKSYDKDHYEKYLYYTPYRRLSGLTPELTCEWKPKCPIVFDAVQLHATNKGFKDNQWTVKMGLLLTFLREIK